MRLRFGAAVIFQCDAVNAARYDARACLSSGAKKRGDFSRASVSPPAGRCRDSDFSRAGVKPRGSPANESLGPGVSQWRNCLARELFKVQPPSPARTF